MSVHCGVHWYTKNTSLWRKPLVHHPSILIHETRKRVMVKLKFIIKDNSLVLRISEGKERYYKSVKHILTGNPNLDANKERFTSYAVSYSENNKSLEEFKNVYVKLLFEHPELTTRQVASYFLPIKQVAQIDLHNFSNA